MAYNSFVLKNVYALCTYCIKNYAYRYAVI